MYSVDVKVTIDMLIGYFGINGVRKKEGGLVDISLHNSNIGSLEELGYLLMVENVRNFYCSWGKNLKDLRGCPSVVYGDFDCDHCNNLESLEGGPSYVGGYFHCACCNKLINLKGSPRVVRGNFNCSGCKELISLDGGPNIVYGDFDCSWCDKLKEIKFDMKRIGKNLNCIECISLEYIDKNIIEKVGKKVYVKGCDKIKDISKLKEKFDDKIDRITNYV